MSECVLLYTKKSKEQQESYAIQHEFEICKKAAKAELGEDTEFIEFFGGLKNGTGVNSDSIKRLCYELDVREIKYLFVYRIDRLSRSVEHIVAIIKECQERGVTIVSASEGVRIDNDAADHIFNILAILAENERLAIVHSIEANKMRIRGREETKI